MLDFDTYITRHGEFWVQDLIERTERFQGIRSNILLPLKDRWDVLMNDQSVQQQYSMAA